MVFLVMTLLLILVTAWCVDLLLSEDEILKWRHSTREARARFSELDVFKATEASNEWFLGLFKAIYHERFFSRRRLYASLISTVIAMILVAYIFEIFGILGYHVLYRSVLSGLVLFTLINFIADYLSLQETLWIMKLSQRRGFLVIFALTILDFILTSLIYSGTVLSILYIVVTFQDQIKELVNFFNEPEFELVDEDVGLGVFFGILASSTYVTSLLWIGFVISAIALRILQLVSPALRRILKVISASERPAFSIAGFLCATTVVFYGVFRTITWLIDSTL